jgi:hypothetical protein
MPFTRETISNADNRITLHGPEEYVGENRYSWLGPLRHAGKTFKALWFRVCRVKGHEADTCRDTFSLIVSFVFSDQSVLVRVHGTEAVPKHLLPSRSMLNIYTNTAQQMCPEFEMPFDLLTCSNYYVAHKADHYGDFLILVGKSQADEPIQQVIVLNLDALLMLGGLDKISLAGDGYYLGERIGVIPSDDQGLALPFFANVTGVAEDSSYYLHVANKFAHVSHARSLEIVRQGIIASRCAVIDFEANNDRGPMDRKKALKEMEEAVANFFTSN